MSTKQRVHIPVRPAPAPPPGKVAHSKQKTVIFQGWNNSFNDLYAKSSLPQKLSQAERANGKKTPPPRPPPPKITFNQKNGHNQPQKPSQLLSSLGDLFSRDSRGNCQTNVNAVSPQCVLPPPNKNDSMSLIDLNSPPSSPTPTTRSSSDGLSVNSFGSDGTFSHNGRHNQVESGFEDDFDVFGGFSSSSATATPSPIVGNIDPFSPPKPVKSVSPAATQSPVLPRSSGFSNPTIIRPKAKPTVAIKPANLQSRTNTVFQTSHFRPVESKPEATHSSFDSGSFEIEGNRSPSPPMPSIPAPVLPPEVLAQLDNTITNYPCGIALYDYAGSHPDDLSFKEGDNIELVRKVNEEWLCGRVCGKEGIFPSNFVQVVNPLPDSDGTEDGAFVATALYPFSAEAWEDLDLKEGAKVKVLARIDADWLYGECEGRRGQFPSNFIDSVPPGLPIKSS